MLAKKCKPVDNTLRNFFFNQMELRLRLRSTKAVIVFLQNKHSYQFIFIIIYSFLMKISITKKNNQRILLRCETKSNLQVNNYISRFAIAIISISVNNNYFCSRLLAYLPVHYINADIFFYLLLHSNRS